MKDSLRFWCVHSRRCCALSGQKLESNLDLILPHDVKRFSAGVTLWGKPGQPCEGGGNPYTERLPDARFTQNLYP